MTPELRDEFESSWGDLRPRLRAMLAARRIPHDRHEDLIQETALRLYGMWERVDRSRPAWPLAKTIALNLVRDEVRSQRSTEVLDDLPERAFKYDLEAAGIARVELERVRIALGSLSSAQRSALLVEIGVRAADTNDAAGADKMVRSRARKRLATLLEEVSALVSLRLAKIPDFLQGAGLFRSAGTPAIACWACIFGVSVAAIGAGPLATDASAKPNAVVLSQGAATIVSVEVPHTKASSLLADSLRVRDSQSGAHEDGTGSKKSGNGGKTSGSGGKTASQDATEVGGGAEPESSAADLDLPGTSPEEGIPTPETVPVTTPKVAAPAQPSPGGGGETPVDAEELAAAVLVAGAPKL